MNLVVRKSKEIAVLGKNVEQFQPSCAVHFGSSGHGPDVMQSSTCLERAWMEH